MDGYLLCKSQDRVAAGYQGGAKQAGKEVKPPAAMPACADPGPFVAAAAASAPAVTAVAAVAAGAVSSAKPLEAAGAHSPTTTAAAPPSSKVTQAEIQGAAKK